MKKILSIVPTVLSLAALLGVAILFGRLHEAPHKMGAPNVNDAQRVAAWWVDTGNVSTHASDANDCQSAVTPCLTYGQITSRWGTNSPYLEQATTITLLSSMTTADPFFVNPTLFTNGALTVQGTPTQTGSFTLTSVTAKNRAAGTPGRINVAAHAWTAGTLVHDTTAHASFWIDADLGGGTAQITEPFTYPVPVTPDRQAIAGGDTIVTLSLPSISLKFVGLTGIAQDSFEGGVFLTDLFVTAETGPGGAVPLTVVSTGVGLAEVALDPTVTMEVTAQITGDATTFTDSFVPHNFSNSSLDGPFTVFGGSLNGTQILAGASLLDGDVLVHGGIFPTGPSALTIGCAYFDVDWWGSAPFVNVLSLSRTLIYPTFFDAALWGPAAINLISGEQLFFGGGATATTTLLNTGGLQVDGASTAYPWVPGSHAWGVAVSVTPALIDSNHGLWNPATGSGFHQ